MKKIRILLTLLCLMVMGTAEVRAQDAYACLTTPVLGSGTLTFYYDNLRSTRAGTTYDLRNFNYLDRPGWKDNNFYKVSFDASFANARPTSTAFWFDGCSNLTTITGIENLNTSDVTSMFYMFAGCSGLTSLDVSHFNTAKVTIMSYMFQNCSKLTSLDVSNFNTSKVTTMDYMFNGCSGLTSLDVSKFKTEMVNYMSSMFSGCSALRTIYCGDSWSASSSTSMFSGCTSLVSQTSGLSYDSSKINATYANPITGYFTDASYAVFTGSNNTLTFYCDGQKDSRPGTSYYLNYGETAPDWISDGNSSLIQHVVFDSSFDFARPVYTNAWFAGLTQLQDITGQAYLHTDEVTYMRSMFQNASGLSSLDLSTFNTGKVTNMDNMFYGCTGLTSLDISSFNTENVTTMSYMFRNCSKLTSLDLSSFNTKKVGNMSCMFMGCSVLQTIIAGDDWSTSAVVNSTNMFLNCTNIKGRKGTTYDGNKTNAEYARFDNAPSSPGYLSDINSAYTQDVRLQFEILGVGALRLIDKDGNIVRSFSIDEPITLSSTVSWAMGTRLILEATAPDGYDLTNATAYLFIDGVYRAMSQETDEDGNIYFTYFKSSITEAHSYTLIFTGLESTAATNNITWNMLMVGDVDVTNNEDPKDYAELWFNQRDLILMAKEGSSLKATNTIDKTSYIPAETPASFYVYVKPGQTFNVTFNGIDVPFTRYEDNDENFSLCYKYEANDYEQFATNGTWVVEFKKANDDNYTWNLKVIGDIPKGAMVDLGLDGMTYEVFADPSNSYLTDVIEPWPNGYYGFSGNITVPKGYTFTLLCNGEDISTDFTYNEALSCYLMNLTAAQSARFNTDINWVIAFTKIDENDVNCDGEVNISDVTKLVNKILEKE